MKEALGKRELNVISEAYRSAGTGSLTLDTRKKAIQLLDSLYPLPSAGRFRTLDTQAKNKLREEIEKDYNIDLLATSELVSERVNRADKSNQTEKSLALPPNHDYVLIHPPAGGASFSSVIKRHSSVPASIRVKYQDIDTSQITQILFIENLQAFDYWQQAKYPCSMANSLILYRGHGLSLSASHRFLKSLSSHIKVVAFCDFDPAGLEIALTLPKLDALIVPSQGALQALLTVSKPEDFDGQHKQRRYLENRQLGVLKAIKQFMLTHRLAVSQEHLIARSVPLEMVPVHPDLIPRPQAGA